MTRKLGGFQTESRPYGLLAQCPPRGPLARLKADPHRSIKSFMGAPQDRFQPPRPRRRQSYHRAAAPANPGVTRLDAGGGGGAGDARRRRRRHEALDGHSAPFRSRRRGPRPHDVGRRRHIHSTLGMSILGLEALHELRRSRRPALRRFTSGRFVLIRRAPGRQVIIRHQLRGRRREPPGIRAALAAGGPFDLRSSDAIKSYPSDVLGPAGASRLRSNSWERANTSTTGCSRMSAMALASSLPSEVVEFLLDCFEVLQIFVHCSTPVTT